MIRLYTSLVLLLCYLTATAQVSFTQLPRDLQLYPRDAANRAEVVVSGTVTAAGHSRIGMQVLREGVLSQIVSQTLNPSLTSAPFSLTSTIRAERAEYSFRVFVYRGADSTQVAERSRVVCGDAYILHGQSNALALANLEQYYSFNFDDKYLRNATYPYGATDVASAMRWYPAKDPYASVGGFGLTLQRLILEQYGIPTVVLNGAVGGTGIAALSARDPANHANLNTIYGQLLYRAQWAGVARQVKAIIWKQGEDEAGNNPVGYDQKFKVFYDQLREDYGNARLYVGQINLLNSGYDGAAGLRDFQRRTKYLFRNVETIANVGAREYDGIHYGPLGHQQMAFEQFRQIARDMYGSTDTLQINSPDVRQVFYNARRDSITLTFEPDMQMVWKDTAYYSFATGEKLGSRELKDVFYLDGQAGQLASGSASGNRVTLALKQSSAAKQLRYLPGYFADALSPYYNGPLLRNARGMRAFTFDGVPIADAIATVTTLAARPLNERQIQLNWTASAGAQTQRLERADGTPTDFKPVATLTGTAATYTDANLPDPLGTYFYQLRAFSPASESAYSNVVRAQPLILGIEPPEPLVRLYPNPVAADRQLRIEVEQTEVTDLTLRDALGRVVKQWHGKASKGLILDLNNLTAGLYVADFHLSDGRTLRRKVVVR